MRKPEIEKRIVEFLQKEYKKAFNYKQIAFAIGATNPANRLDVINILDTLAEADEILEVALGQYKAKANRGTDNVGYFVLRSNGLNSVIIVDENNQVA